MRELLPRSRPLTDADLLQLYAAVPADQPLLRLNFVTTVDGSAQGPDGLSGSINTDADHLVFDLLRAWADVIVIGSGTVVAERYDAPRTPARWQALRAGRPADPAMAVLSRTGTLPAGMDTHGRADVFVIDTDTVGEAVGILHDRDYRHILCEGGPTIARALLEAGLVDEICLTTSPLLVLGDGPRFVTAQQWQPTPLRLESLIEEDGTLIARWSVERT
ncbi:pyrimidine reductase family protein [Calidifontibacter sp. DB0510]|uniref:Pyrimidine reductase family protein n=1 Tax=Metallococcus carri TaxID=1656884 RepID=A0A967B2Q8_9MICO|nr:dihydrofolate reductase family protein [Metallococcus carri]NHN56932.1 pyrimidine reductase family protein [Metallococcus carri]NOP37677.1 pyrimidine reductase family protein [Calidifontibacter sp. DB2511S]